MVNQCPTELEIKAPDDNLASPRSGDHLYDHFSDTARLKTIRGVGIPLREPLRTRNSYVFGGTGRRFRAIVESTSFRSHNVVDI